MVFLFLIAFVFSNPNGIHFPAEWINLRGNAIWLEVCRQINVEANNITLQPQFIGDAMSGITVKAERRNRINQNTILGNQVGQADTMVVGIDVFASGQTIVTCNKSRSVGRHVVFQGPCLGSDFLGNEMTDGVDGVVWRLNGRIGIQGSQGVPSDNRWYGTFTTGQTHAVSSIGNNSRLHVRSLNPYYPTVNAPVGSAFAMQPLGGNISANPFVCTTMTVVSPKPTAIQNSVNGGNPTTSIDSAMKYRSEEWAYETLLEDSLLLATDTMMQNYYNIVDPTDQGAASRANEFIKVPDTVSAIMESANIHPSSLILNNHKIIQAIRFDDGEIDSSELAMLLQIAGQCEELGGKAVNIARSVLASEGIFVWVNPVCSGSAHPFKKQSNYETVKPLAQDVRCWPNPASDMLYFGFFSQNMLGKIELFDGRGTKATIKDFHTNDCPLVLNITSFSQGIYLARASFEDGSSLSWKIVIQR